jgi:hypothetical protein
MTKQIKNEILDVIDHDDYEVPETISETEAIIYDWVVHCFGESEAEDPSWNISELAKYLDEMKALQDATGAEYKQSNTVKYRL